jgi:cell division protease FtsH
MSQRSSSPSSKTFRLTLLLLGLVPLALWLFWAFVSGTEPRRAPYSELVADVEAGRVQTAEVEADRIVAKVRDESGKKTQSIAVARIPRMDERSLLDAMESQHVVVSGQEPRSAWWGPALWLGIGLPLLSLPLVLWMMSGKGSATKGRPMTFGRSKAKLYDRSAEQPATFDDVAGVEEAKAELVEVVRFLKEPERYRAIGAHIPKGVLLVGAPGTGKTLLARAVAGESGVPFFSMSGSEFVEMFVGVGASRVRDLFEQAKERAPCVIFIDELDALGKARAGANGLASNEEREQTLNQLLVEMDGFAPGSGLVIMAATNRPEILDRALLRAGRFDRQVLVDRPDVRGREAIVRVHARKVLLAPGVDLAIVARRTPGMVGADLANVVNEAALASVRRNATAVTAEDFEEAMDRLQLGLKKEGRVMNDEEKRRVAFHEAGHALVALSVRHADPVHRVTIIPRSIGALGATLQLPTDERYVLTREELEDRLCVLLGGRSAEEIACGSISTGAQDDLERATAIAKQMVCRLGMSDALGPLTWGRTDALRLVQGPEVVERDYSEETARAIDAEVRRIVEASHAHAVRILRDRSEALDAIARSLLVKETLERGELEELAGAPSERRPVAAAVA